MIAQIRAELLKIRSTRTTLGLILAMIALILLFTLLTGLLTHPSGLASKEDQRQLLSVGSFAGVFSALAGVLLVTSEYRYGTIRPTILFNPARSHVLAAKVVAGALAGIAFGVLGEAIGWATGYAILDGRGITVVLGSRDILLLTLGGLAGAALWGAIGAASARSSTTKSAASSRCSPGASSSTTSCSASPLRWGGSPTLAPAEVWAILLDEGIYRGSQSQLLSAAAGPWRDPRAPPPGHPPRRGQARAGRRPGRTRSIRGTSPSSSGREVDLLLPLRDPRHLHPLCGRLDGRLGESAALAEELIADTFAKQRIRPGQLTIHADRGSSMTSKPVALLLADLGVTQSHSRPHVSNDNPYSEAQFKTLKYRPAFPARFGSIEAARIDCRTSSRWYNHEHRHSGLGLHTAADVHHGQAPAIRSGRATVLAAAYRAHPERFVRQPPAPPTIPAHSWINPPARTELIAQ